MSRMYFHFQEGPTLAVLGAERGWLDSISRNAAFGAIGLSGDFWATEDIVTGFKPFVGNAFDKMNPRDDFSTNTVRYTLDSTFRGEPFSWRGKTMEAFAMRLNTSIVVGSDPVALAAKIHGTCEIHGRFLGKDRAWLADLIEQAMDANIFRRSYWAPRDRDAELRTLMKLPVTEQQAEFIEHSMGWTEVVEQLRKSDQGTVVMSYSVTDGFPEMPSDWMPEGGIPASDDPDFDSQEYRHEQFYELPEDEKFALALAELEQEGQNEPISPTTLRGVLFRHELTWLDLMRNDIKKIEKQLKLEPES